MRRTRSLAVLLAVLVAGCAADGGQRGSGITSAVGNVASAGAPGAAIAGVTVSVEDTDLVTATDAEGRFEVRGRFGGPTTLVFERAADRIAARLYVNAPAAGALTLADVRLASDSPTARADTIEVVFEARVVAVDCAAGRLTCASAEASEDDPDSYVVNLEHSSVRDRDGNERACADLHGGDRLAVDAFYAEDGTMGNADIVVE